MSLGRSGASVMERVAVSRPRFGSSVLALLLVGLTLNACSNTILRSTRGSTASSPTSSSSTTVSSQTSQVGYEPFTSHGEIDPALVVTEHVSGTCNPYGVAGSSYRCFAQPSHTIYDPCFVRPGATSGTLVCPVNPASPYVVELNVVSLPRPSGTATEKRAWAMQLLNGQVCVVIDAAWGGLGPFSCSIPYSTSQGPPADCHAPLPGSPWWTAACQIQQADSSQFTAYTVAKIWT